MANLGLFIWGGIYSEKFYVVDLYLDTNPVVPSTNFDKSIDLRHRFQ